MRSRHKNRLWAFCWNRSSLGFLSGAAELFAYWPFLFALTAQFLSTAAATFMRTELPSALDVSPSGASRALLSDQPQTCYSCASSAYLAVWNHLLMHHYYPPKNFTDKCWHPDFTVGVTPCQTVCFTLVEEVYDYGRCFHNKLTQ